MTTQQDDSTKKHSQGAFTFLTLTVDPAMASRLKTPLSARYWRWAVEVPFLIGAEERGLALGGVREVVMEYGRNGLPHFHVLTDRAKRFPAAELVHLSEVWGWGRVNVELRKGGAL